MSSELYNEGAFIHIHRTRRFSVCSPQAQAASHSLPAVGASAHVQTRGPTTDSFTCESVRRTLARTGRTFQDSSGALEGLSGSARSILTPRNTDADSLKISIIKVAQFFYPKPIRSGTQVIQEAVETPNPSIHGLGNVGAHVAATLGLGWCPCLLGKW